MKPKVAFFDFASCEGCQLAILNCEDILLDILNLVELVEFREAMSEKAPRYDVAFVEGSIHRDEDIERLRHIRSRSTYLVALGACACNGNVQARSNYRGPGRQLQGSLRRGSTKSCTGRRRVLATVVSHPGAAGGRRGQRGFLSPRVPHRS